MLSRFLQFHLNTGLFHYHCSVADSHIVIFKGIVPIAEMFYSWVFSIILKSHLHQNNYFSKKYEI